MNNLPLMRGAPPDVPSLYKAQDRPRPPDPEVIAKSLPYYYDWIPNMWRFALLYDSPFGHVNYLGHRFKQACLVINQIPTQFWQNQHIYGLKNERLIFEYRA